jgi:SAM-dependent methyltransferase
MTSNGDDMVVVRKMARALRPGGRLVLSAFNAYFAVKYFEKAIFDADTGVNHERTHIKNLAGEEHEVDLWTGCYTPRELRLVCRDAGLEVRDVFSVDPGQYRREAPSVESSEFLVVAFCLPVNHVGPQASEVTDI